MKNPSLRPHGAAGNLGYAHLRIAPRMRAPSSVPPHLIEIEPPPVLQFVVWSSTLRLPTLHGVVATDDLATDSSAPTMPLWRPAARAGH